MESREKETDTVSRYQYEGMESVFQMIIRRLTWAVIIVVALLAAVTIYSYRSLSKANQALLEAHEATLDYLSQYDYVGDSTETTMQQDGEGINIIGGGDVNYVPEGNG